MAYESLWKGALKVPGALERIGQSWKSEGKRANPDTAAAREALLFAAVGIPSLSREEQHFGIFLQEHLPLFGWEQSWIDPMGNCLASRGNGKKELLLVGHLDTVPGGPDPEVVRGTLWGRGSVDAKGPLCAFIAAAGAVEIPPEWKITLVGVVGEEEDSRGMRYFMQESHPRTPQGCLIGEPSGVEGITLGYRGRGVVKLWDKDSGAHRSGDPGAQTKVLKAAAAVLAWVDNKDEPAKDVIHRPSGAVFSMEGKEAGTRHGAIEIDLRLPLNARVEEWKKELFSMAESFSVRIDWGEWVPGAITSKGDPLVRALRVGLRRHGHGPRLLAKGGTADLNYAAYWGCPLCAYGPGDSRLDHTSTEHLYLEEYHQSIDVLEESLSIYFR